MDVAVLVAFAACSPPTYLKVGTENVAPYSVCGGRRDGGWGFMSPSAGPRATKVFLQEAGSVGRLAPNRNCIRAGDDCRVFVLFTLDAGLYSPEECTRSRVTIEESSDGGDLIEAIAWCPSGLVRLKAESTGECPPTYIY